ncbi:lipoprotein [Streptomyces sp. SP18CS02]|uniref:lipoprotein n=1 Tax=Streptomyces sp. SP18CS02 TaxID=3002531 RepID=UPI002E783082|nr:lipoprotein [Streptomyces sp. SP18CS02]MEE1755871.1 lipoprotein [Streptomyces sp. SP18CS02]
MARHTGTVLVAAVLLAGCTSAAEDGGSRAAGGAAGRTASPSASASPGPAAAARGGSVGGAGSPCALPVSFATAKDWVPKKVTRPGEPELADLVEQGTVEVVCEIDAKPAGNIGFLRVWTGARTDSASPREVLEAFLADEKKTGGVRYRETKAGALAATEVTYTVTNELLDETKDERAFAVRTARGPVIVHLGGLDSQEHAQMLPAYELAKSSLTLTP